MRVCRSGREGRGGASNPKKTLRALSGYVFRRPEKRRRLRRCVRGRVQGGWQGHRGRGPRRALWRPRDDVLGATAGAAISENLGTGNRAAPNFAGRLSLREVRPALETTFIILLRSFSNVFCLFIGIAHILKYFGTFWNIVEYFGIL